MHLFALPLGLSHEDGDVASTSNKRPSPLRRHVVDDCRRRRLASATMAEYTNLQFVVSDGSVGSGCVDFDNGPDDLTVLGHWLGSLRSSLIVWAMPSVTAMRNVHHNNVMFIHQLAGPNGINCVVFVACVLFVIICKKGICFVVGMGFTPVVSKTHINVVM